MGNIQIVLAGNLSEVWASVFLELLKRGISELSPVLVTVTDFADGMVNENAAIRMRLDEELKVKNKRLTNEVSSTIFPRSLWKPYIEHNAEKLFEVYDRLWPAIQKRDTANKKGVYFRRLTSFEPKGYDSDPVNQLQHIIDTFKNGNHRSSALQAAIFDPTRDHSNAPILGFPCLDHVGFSLVGTNGLCVTGYYTMQYIFEKAYGNYLGLCDLGRFMAEQLGRELVQMNCITSVAKLGVFSKSDMRCLENDLIDIMNELP